MRKAIGTAEYAVLQRLCKRFRLEANLTQAELAARLHTGVSRISEYEHGERRMDLVQLLDYTEALGIPLVEFVAAFAEEVATERGATSE